MAIDFNKLISDLKVKLTATNDRLANLREARRPHALDAVTGDAKAKKTIAVLDAKVVNATVEGETLAMALEEAERRKVEYEAKAAEEDRLRREAEAREIADEIAKASAKVDQVAAQLAQCLDTRTDLIGKLGETGVVYPGVLNALRNPLRLRAALWVAGLGRHGVLEHVVGTHQKPLSQADAIPESLIGRPQTEAETRQEGAAA
jgi:hypothetical protein